MKNFKRVLSLALAALMVIGGLVIAPVDAKADETYTRVTSVSEIAAGGEFVIVAKHSNGNYAFTGEAVSKWGQKVEVTLDSDNKLTSTSAPVLVIEEGTAANQVYIKSGTSYVQGANANALYTTTTKTDSLTEWLVTDADGDGEIQFQLVGSTDARSLVLNYNEGNPGFRAYKDTTTGTAYVRELLVYKVGTDGGSTPDPDPVVPEEPTPTVGTIADALAGDAGSLWSVKGVVTFVEGKNVYIQDATGGICIYCSDAPTDIELGDTIEAVGSRTTFNGLPELGSATYTKSTGLTLEAKTTTIGALTTADICTYVKLTGLTVTEVYDNNGAYTTPNLTLSDGTDTIQIYKAVVEKDGDNWAVAVGDTVDVLASVGVYNTTLQLRNTLASEITVVANAEDDTTDTGSEDDTTDTGSENDTTDTGSENESESEVETESEETYTTVTKDILDQAAALASGEKLEGLYQAKGTVTDVDTSGFAQYGNIEFTLQLDGMEETILCWRVTVDAEDAVEVGDVLLVKGEIKKYNDIIEFAYPTIEAATIESAGDLDMTSTVMFLIAGFGVVVAAVLGKKKFA